jgi:hypothetical protein
MGVPPGTLCSRSRRARTWDSNHPGLVGPLDARPLGRGHPTTIFDAALIEDRYRRSQSDARDVGGGKACRSFPVAGRRVDLLCSSTAPSMPRSTRIRAVPKSTGTGSAPGPVTDDRSVAGLICQIAPYRRSPRRPLDSLIRRRLLRGGFVDTVLSGLAEIGRKQGKTHEPSGCIRCQ